MVAGRRRVVVVTHTGERGGAEHALLRLIAAADDRFAVSIVTLADGPFVAEARAGGIPVTVLDGGALAATSRGSAASLGRLGANARSSLRVARTLRRAVREADADLVVAHSLKAAVLLALAIGRRRWVWHLHDRLSADYLSRPVAVALRLLAALGPRRVVANSRATAATVGRLARRRVVVAYPGLEASAFDPVRRPAGRTQDGPVGIVGRVSATKGQRQFVEAATLVAAEDAAAGFTIVGAALFGDAPYEAELDELIRDSPVGGRIERIGWTDDPRRELERLGVFVHASPVPEPFGQVVVEALAAEVPVVASDAGGVVEILDPAGEATVVADGVRLGAYGMLVRPGDPAGLAAAVLAVRRDPEAADRRARAGRASAQHRFTVEETWRVVSRTWLAVSR